MSRKRRGKIKKLVLGLVILTAILVGLGCAWNQADAVFMYQFYNFYEGNGVSAIKNWDEINVNMADLQLAISEKVEDITATPIEMPIQIMDQIVMNSETEIIMDNYQIDNFEVFKEQLKMFYNLKRVSMCDTNLSNEQMDELCKTYPDTKFVWVVHCGNFRVRTDAIAFSTMYTGYGWDPMTEVDFESLKYCTDLEALDIGHHSMHDISFLKNLKKLKILIIAINRFQDISPLAELKDITYLELFLNDIRDLSPIEGLVNLEHLNLCHNKNLGSVEPILHYSNLKRLWISYCNLSAESKEMIRQAYPNIQLEFDVYESVEAGWRSTEVYTRMRNVFNNNQMDEMFLPKVQRFYE